MTDSLRISADDRFALVGMNSPKRLFPHPFTLGNFAVAARQLEMDWDLMWDFRETEERIYEDVKDAYDEAAAYSSSRNLMVAGPHNLEMVQELTRQRQALHDKPEKILVMGPNRLDRHEFELGFFGDDNFDLLDVIDYIEIDKYAEDSAQPAIDQVLQELTKRGEYLPAEAETTDHSLLAMYDELHAARSRYLDGFLRSIGQNSTLVEILVQVERDAVTVVPYHAHSIHAVDTPNQLTLVRPGRRSDRYYRAFQRDIQRLELLLNDPSTSEYDIEKLLRGNPLFLRGLNYKEIYPQVILPRPGAKGLRPDLICEPFDSEWAHIVELKLPTEKVIVGRDNRARLAEGIHSAVRQLREYSAFFDDRRLAHRIEREYGFKCYKPSLAVIIGRDPSGYDEEEQRRAMTTYPDLQIITYDRLLRAARELPLW